MITFEPYSETNDTVADNMASVCFPPFPLLLLSLIYHYFKNRYTVERNRMLEKLRYILSEKMLSLDFEKVDDAVIQDKVLQIEQINRWSRFGLCMVVFTLERMLQAIAGIAGALMLTVSFFQAKAVKSAFLWMNSPLFAIVFLAGILGFTTLASRLWNGHRT